MFTIIIIVHTELLISMKTFSIALAKTEPEGQFKSQDTGLEGERSKS